MVATNHASSAWVEEVWVGDRETPITVTEDGRVVAIPPPAPSRRMPIKTRTIAMEGDYAGWTAVVRTNAPFATFLRLTELSGDAGQTGLQALAELYAILPKLVLGWNFVDEDGAPLPCNREGFAQLPADLMVQLLSNVTTTSGEDDPKG